MCRMGKTTGKTAVRTGEGPVVYKVGEKTAVCTGEGLLVYRVGERQQFVQEKGFWCTNRVNSGEIASQRDGGGRDEA